MNDAIRDLNYISYATQRDNGMSHSECERLFAHWTITELLQFSERYHREICVRQDRHAARCAYEEEVRRTHDQSVCAQVVRRLYGGA